MAVKLRTVLVLRALKLGDLVTAVPALRAVAQRFPLHRRLLACPAWLAPLAYTTAAVDDVLPVGELEPLPRIEPAVAINLHGRGPQSTQLLEATAPGELITFRARTVSTSVPEWRADEHEILRWCRLLRESGIAADPSDRHLRPPRRTVPAAARGATLVHPGASSPARRWPAERFAVIARAERDAGRRVLVTGSAAEVAIAREVARAAGLPPDAVLAGGTDVLGLAALVAAAGRVCSGDTGIAHLAYAYRTPSVTLFGPVPPAHWGPLGGHDRHVALWAGRRGDPHGLVPDSGLLEITVDDVRRALDALPDASIGRLGRRPQ